MYKISGLVFCGCLALGYGLLFGDAPNSLLAMSGGSGMAGMSGGVGGGDPFSALFGGGFNTGMGAGAGMSATPGMGMGAPASMGAGAGANSMDSMFYTLSRMTLCGETPSRIRYKTRGSCNPYDCNRMTTGHDVACLGHSCCCKTFQCTIMLDA